MCLKVPSMSKLITCQRSLERGQRRRNVVKRCKRESEDILKSQLHPIQMRPSESKGKSAGRAVKRTKRRSEVTLLAIVGLVVTCMAPWSVRWQRQCQHRLVSVPDLPANTSPLLAGTRISYSSAYKLILCYIWHPSFFTRETRRDHREHNHYQEIYSPST